MSPGRIALVAMSAAIGFVAGFYGGLFLLLATVGLEEFEGWQFEPVTVPPAVLLAALGAALAAPDTRRVIGRVLSVAVITILILLVVLTGLDGDFGLVILLGGAITVATLTGAVVAFHT